MNPVPRRYGLNRVDSLLTPFIREFGIEDGVRLADIKRNWYNLFNKPLSYHMSPSMLSGNEIVLNVDSPVWLQELKFYKEDIIKTLSLYGVKAVRFKLGRVSKKSGVRSQKSRVKSLNDSEHSFIEEIVSHLKDEPLRAVVKTAIKKAIEKGKTKIR